MKKALRGVVRSIGPMTWVFFGVLLLGFGGYILCLCEITGRC
jgi:hypothetical protein